MTLTIVPPADPGFLGELLRILGEPSSIDVTIHSSTVENLLARVARKKRLKLEGPVESKASVKCSRDELMRIYEEQHQRYKDLEDSKRWQPLLSQEYFEIQRVTWHRAKEERTENGTIRFLGTKYSLTFDVYSLRGEIDSSEEPATLEKISKIAHTYRVRTEILLK